MECFQLRDEKMKLLVFWSFRSRSKQCALSTVTTANWRIAYLSRLVLSIDVTFWSCNNCTCSRLDNTFQKEQHFFYFYVSYQISFIKTTRLLFCNKIYGNIGTKGTLKSQGQVFAIFVIYKIFPICFKFQII